MSLQKYRLKEVATDFGVTPKDIAEVMGKFFEKPKSNTQVLTEEELITAVEAAASLGITKVRITGGEPLVKKNIVSICRNVAAVEGIQEVCLTTNGILLPQLGKQLKEAGYGVYYLSNFFQKADEDCKDLMGFLELTDGGILSYKDKVTKPDRQIYGLLLERFGLKAEECVFLDDTKKNIDGARAVGIHGILFHDREQAVAELQKLGVKTE